MQQPSRSGHQTQVESPLHSPAIVSRTESESLIAAIERATADPRAGIFGPQSMSWRINRESALFLGAARAALLQLAHPWVSTSLEQHSSLMDQPIARFHHTFRIVFAMIFGSRDQAAAAARHLYTVHTYIRGEITEDIAAYRRGSTYEANEIGALRWVYATLIESAVLAYECVLPPLAPQELAAYYAEAKTLATLFGLPASALPRDWIEFLGYCRAMENSNLLGVTEQSRSMAHNLLRGAGSWIKPPQWYCSLTAEWLPRRFRSEFGLKFDDTDRHAATRAKRWLPRIYCTLPPAIRFVGPWHEAQARLRGRALGSIGQRSNRFWIGQSRLPFANVP
jgi:uncharacterized protein (DUF2236 family)